MNLPSIPDNFNKILLLLSLGLIFYCHLEFEKEKILHENFITKTKAQILNDKNTLSKINNEIDFTFEDLDYIVKINKLDDPYLINSNKDLEFDYNTISGDNVTKSAQDSIRKLIRKYRHNKTELELVENSSDILEKEIDEILNRKNITFSLLPILISAAFILCISIINLYYENSIRIRSLENDLLNNPKNYDCCQSCAKKFSSMVKNGTNSDLSTNKSFCDECFVAGNFTAKYSNLNEVIQEIKNNNELSYFTKLNTFTKAKYLDRWKTNPY